MPASPFNDRVVVLKKSGKGFNRSGQAILDRPIQLEANWKQTGFKALLHTPIPIPIGSQVWRGTLDEYTNVKTNSANLDLWVVQSNNRATDIRGREPKYVANLVPYSVSQSA